MESSHPEVVAELLVHTAPFYDCGRSGREGAQCTLWEHLLAAPIGIGADDGGLPFRPLGLPVCRGVLLRDCGFYVSGGPALLRRCVLW